MINLKKYKVTVELEYVGTGDKSTINELIVAKDQEEALEIAEALNDVPNPYHANAIKAVEIE